MFGADTLVGWIGENLKAIAPARTIRSYQGGVKFTLGVPGGWREWWLTQRGRPLKTEEVKPLKTGLRWFFPILQSIETNDTNDDAIDMKVQNITTADDVVVAISLNIPYRIENSVLYHTGMQAVETNFESIARIFVNNKARSWQYAELRSNQTALEKEIGRALRARAKKWGIDVGEPGITDFSRTKVFRILGEPATTS